MASSTSRLFRHSFPAAAALVSSSTWSFSSSSSSSRKNNSENQLRNNDDDLLSLFGSSSPALYTQCEAQRIHKNSYKPVGMRDDAAGYFHNLFPRRQLWQPRVEYPLWDDDWDGNQPEPTGNEEEYRRKMRQLRKEGVTRHIILVRHGHYNEKEQDESKRGLSELGRKQCEITGQRLRAMLDGIENNSKGELGKVKVLRVSNMTRAKQTAEIIAAQLGPGVECADPDAGLNEGRPAHNIPGGRASESTILTTDHHHRRIEESFQRYFYRASPPKEDKGDEKVDSKQPKHEYEIIVCHANVIRYFLCRALQIPPEAWLRLCTFNCSLTYLTIRPTGTVSCRMLGDIGHLPYDLVSFSNHSGFNW